MTGNRLINSSSTVNKLRCKPESAFSDSFVVLWALVQGQLEAAIFSYLKLLKAGVNPKAVFWLGIMFLMQISRLRFKQLRIFMLISHSYVLGCFVNFLVIFRYIWREIVFLKGLVKLMEIGNFEDLLLF